MIHWGGLTLTKGESDFYSSPVNFCEIQQQLWYLPANSKIYLHIYEIQKPKTNVHDKLLYDINLDFIYLIIDILILQHPIENISDILGYKFYLQDVLQYLPSGGGAIAPPPPAPLEIRLC